MSDHDRDGNNTAAALDFARSTTEPHILTVTFEGGEEEILVTTGANGEAAVTTIRDLFADRAVVPLRRKGTVVVHDLASFIAAVNRDNDAGSVVADVAARKLTAILDWHNPGRDARWGQDRIEYGFTASEQLAVWSKAAQFPMNQKDFARLIDDRLGDIGEGPFEPGSIAAEFVGRRGIRFASIADLVVFTRTIAAKSTVESQEIVDENTGDVSIQYVKRGDVKTPDGKPIVVPQAFALKIPVFRGVGATEFNIATRLRYDISERGIAWRVELHALDKYVSAAVEEALIVLRGAKDAGGCGIPVFLGVAP